MIVIRGLYTAISVCFYGLKTPPHSSRDSFPLPGFPQTSRSAFNHCTNFPQSYFSLSLPPSVHLSLHPFIPPSLSFFLPPSVPPFLHPSLLPLSLPSSFTLSYLYLSSLLHIYSRSPSPFSDHHSDKGYRKEPHSPTDTSRGLDVERGSKRAREGKDVESNKEWSSLLDSYNTLFEPFSPDHSPEHSFDMYDDDIPSSKRVSRCGHINYRSGCGHFHYRSGCSHFHYRSGCGHINYRSGCSHFHYRSGCGHINYRSG